MMLHGDCLELLPRVATGSVDMVFADLPYGVTDNKWDSVIPFEPLWAELLRVGKRNAAFVFTATQPFATALVNSQPKLFRYDLVWAKNAPTGFLNAKKMPLRRHENVYIFYRFCPVYNPQKTPGKAYKKKDTGLARTLNYRKQHVPGVRVYDGRRHPDSVLFFDLDPRCQILHPTQKPVGLLEWLIQSYSNPGDTVLDPTAGSGTAMVACANTGRHGIGIERDATYFARAQARLDRAHLTLRGAA